MCVTCGQGRALAVPVSGCGIRQTSFWGPFGRVLGLCVCACVKRPVCVPPCCGFTRDSGWSTPVSCLAAATSARQMTGAELLDCAAFLVLSCTKPILAKPYDCRFMAGKAQTVCLSNKCSCGPSRPPTSRRRGGDGSEQTQSHAPEASASLYGRQLTLPMRGDTLRRCSSSGDLAAFEYAQQSCGGGGEGVTRLRQLHAPGQASRADPARPAFWSGRGCSAACVLIACMPRRRPLFDCERSACARRCGSFGRSAGSDQGCCGAAGGHGDAEVRQRLCRQVRATAAIRHSRGQQRPLPWRRSARLWWRSCARMRKRAGCGREAVRLLMPLRGSGS